MLNLPSTKLFCSSEICFVTLSRGIFVFIVLNNFCKVTNNQCALQTNMLLVFLIFVRQFSTTFGGAKH